MMMSSGRIGRRRRRNTRKVSVFATTAVALALVSSLIGSTIVAADHAKNQFNSSHKGGNKFENKNRYQGLRGETASVNNVNQRLHFKSVMGRKLSKIRHLTVPRDDFSIQVDGSLQLPQQQNQTSIIQSESNGDHNSEIPPIRPRIVGGSEDSDLDSFVMHLHYVAEDGMWKFAGCGGSLISKCHILTAGHCLSGDRLHRTKAVYVNAWRPFSSNKDQSTGKIKPYHVSLIDMVRTVTHPKFNSTGNLNDIAVLTMDQCISDTRSDLFEIMEVADDNFWGRMSKELLVTKFEENGVFKYLDAVSNTSVAGFGQKDPNDPSVPPALQSVNVSLFGRDDCEERYNEKLLFSSIDLIQPDMYCAGAPAGGKDSCLGDSGGPNYYTDPETSIRTQLGVVSWGIGCAEVGFPGVYTSVAYHYDFIKAAVCGDERLGDFGASMASTSSQSAPTAASPLKLCLPKDIPLNNNSSDFIPEFPIIIGDNSSNQIKDGPIDEKIPGCLEEFAVCKADGECCGDDLVCNKRDKRCRIKPRGYKGRLADGVHGGSGSSQNTRNNNG